MNARTINQKQFLYGAGAYFLLLVIFISSLGAGCIPTTPAAKIQLAPPVSGFASWYSYETCWNQGKFDSCIMANGQEFDDKKLTVASWDYPFGTRLKVTNLQNDKSVIVTVTDRGPDRRLRKEGVIVDLSKAAFLKISPLKAGILLVDVERILDAKR